MQAATRCDVVELGWFAVEHEPANDDAHLVMRTDVPPPLPHARRAQRGSPCKGGARFPQLREDKRGGGLTKEGAQQYVWANALQIEALLDGQGAATQRYAYAHKANVPELIFKKTGSTETAYRVITDERGSPLYVVSINDGTDVWLEAEYSAWGEITRFVLDGVDQANTNGDVDVSDWPIPFGFSGGLFDSATGLVRFGARDYDPTIGRWVSKDPILFEGGQTNLYVYVGNDPVGFVDPEGLFLPALAIGICVGGGCEAAGAAALSAAVWGASTLAAAWAGTQLGKWAAARWAEAIPGAGPHSVPKYDENGRVDDYTTFDEFGRAVRRFRGSGKPHGGVKPPLILEPKVGKGPGSPPRVPREPDECELPPGY
jgi:RHS repeat-associated protein